jgi:hypothetical protein
MSGKPPVNDRNCTDQHFITSSTKIEMNCRTQVGAVAAILSSMCINSTIFSLCCCSSRHRTPYVRIHVGISAMIFNQHA